MLREEGGDCLEAFTEKQLENVLRAPESKQLLKMLQSSGGTAFRQAVEAARTGNYAAVEQILDPTLRKPEVEALAKKLKEQIG